MCGTKIIPNPIHILSIDLAKVVNRQKLKCFENASVMKCFKFMQIQHLFIHEQMFFAIILQNPYSIEMRIIIFFTRNVGEKMTAELSLFRFFVSIWQFLTFYYTAQCSHDLFF